MKKRKRIIRKDAVITKVRKRVDKVEIKEEIVKKVGEIARELGYEVYIVGGYVRDYLLKRERTDYDFTVVGDALAFAKELAKRFNTKAVLYKEFRTAMVPAGDNKLEFVGTRRERYEEDSRKPIVEEGNLEDDLRRRDFTCNALAASLNEENYGLIIDAFNGLNDLEAGMLRTPLNPFDTFNDDPLRMVRAARFAAQLNFKIDNAAFTAAKKMSNRIQIVSQERVTEEMMKILKSPSPGWGFKLLKKMDLLKYIFSELDKLSGVEAVKREEKVYTHKDVLNHSIKVLDGVAEESDNVWLRFAALIHDIGKPATKEFIEGTGWAFHGHEEVGARKVEKTFRRLKLPMEKVDYVEKLVRLHQRPMGLVDDGVTDSAVRRLAVNAGDALVDLFLLCKADITTQNPEKARKYLQNYDKVAEKVIDVQERDKLREFQSPVKGEEIMEICDLEPSRTVGVIKEEIEEAILDGIIPNEYTAAKEYFLQNKDKWLEQIESGEKK